MIHQPINPNDLTEGCLTLVIAFGLAVSIAMAVAAFGG